MPCRKCGSKSLIRMEFPLENKGLKCIICGADMWYDMIDMSSFLYRHEILPKVLREEKVLH